MGRKVYATLSWTGTSLRILDQTKLPEKAVYLELKDEKEVWQAIRHLKIRGAPALGIAAAYGLYLGVKDYRSNDWAGFLRRLEEVKSYLETSRPTAVNLFSSLQRIAERVVKMASCSPREGKRVLLGEAKALHQEDQRLCQEIAKNGFPLIPDRGRVLTHCNAGALATGGSGTALGIIFYACKMGKKVSVFVDETRPLLQGSRLTVWELQQRGIEVTLICDNMAGWIMRQGKIDLVLVGADRIAANGDTANKIGTYSLAVLAHHHQIPFYVAAPTTTFDLSLSDGSSIPIEERPAEEVFRFAGKRTAPSGTAVYNPAFDVTPASLITGFVTDRGILHPPFSF